MSLMAFATYFPEYVRARMSAGLIFKMLQEQPKIDSSNPAGIEMVSLFEKCVHRSSDGEGEQMPVRGSPREVRQFKIVLI